MTHMQILELKAKETLNTISLDDYLHNWEAANNLPCLTPRKLSNRSNHDSCKKGRSIINRNDRQTKTVLVPKHVIFA